MSVSPNSWYLEPGNNPVNSPGLGIDLVMPGVDILSTYLNNGYATASGTSMAAPHAAGLAALHIAENGRATNAEGVYEIRQALIDQGKAWDDPEYGLTYTWGPDKHQENLGWAGDPDTVAVLTVNITEPKDGDWLEGTVAIQAVADYSESDASIDQVEFFVDNQSLRIDDDGSDGWSIEWVTTDVADATASADPRLEVASVEFLVGETSLGDGKLNLETGVWSVSWNTDERDDADGPLYPDGVYTIEALATVVLEDAEEQVARDSITVTVDNTEPLVETMTVKLEGEVDHVNRNMWEAIATVTVTDALGVGVTGVTVGGRWDSGATVTEYTNSDGVATFYSGNLRYNRVDSITFTLENVVADGYDRYETEHTEIVFSSDGDVEVSSAWRSLEDELLSPVDPSAYLSAVDQLMATAW